MQYTEAEICIGEVSLFFELLRLFANLILQDGTENRNIESLSLIDAVMPDIVATRQNQQNHTKNMLKIESDKNGEEGKHFDFSVSC